MTTIKEAQAWARDNFDIDLAYRFHEEDVKKIKTFLDTLIEQTIKEERESVAKRVVTVLKDIGLSSKPSVNGPATRYIFTDADKMLIIKALNQDK